MSFFPRNPLSEADAHATAGVPQPVLVGLAGLGLEAKQAHWNASGTRFLSTRLKLDGVVESAQNGADAVAERVAQLGVSPGGCAEVVAETAARPGRPAGFQSVPSTLGRMNDAPLAVSGQVHAGIAPTERVGPLTGDLLQGIGEEVEAHPWVLQAVEADGQPEPG